MSTLSTTLGFSSTTEISTGSSIGSTTGSFIRNTTLSSAGSTTEDTTETPFSTSTESSTLNDAGAAKLLTTLTTLNCLSYFLKEAELTYNGYQVLQFSPMMSNTTGFEQVKELLGVQGLFEFLSTPTKVDNFDVMICPQNAEKVKQFLDFYEFSYKVTVEDVGMIINEAKSEHNEAIEKSEGSFSFTAFHPFDKIMEWLNETVSNDDFKRHIKLEKYGTSTDKRKLQVVRISTNKKGFGKNPGIYIVGGLHGHEWTTVSSVLFIIQKLKDIIQDDPGSPLTSQVDWYLVPLANPDGYAYTQTRDRLWRKTRYANAREDENCYGIDPQRNFEFRFNESGSSAPACSSSYQGSKAASALEVLALQNQLKKRAKEISLFVSLESHGGHISLPGLPGNKKTSDLEKLAEVANTGVEILNDDDKASYKVLRPEDLLYMASGRDIDYAKEVAKIKYSFKIDLSDDGEKGLFLPASKNSEIGLSVMKAIAAMMDEIQQSPENNKKSKLVKGKKGKGKGKKVLLEKVLELKI